VEKTIRPWYLRLLARRLNQRQRLSWHRLDGVAEGAEEGGDAGRSRETGIAM
jgi:hypothetical protein